MYRLLSLTTDEWMEKKLFFSFKNWINLEAARCARCRARSMREQILTQFWTTNFKDHLDLANSIQTKAAFSYVIAVYGQSGRLDLWKAPDRCNICGKCGDLLQGRLFAMVNVMWKPSKSLK